MAKIKIDATGQDPEESVGGGGGKLPDEGVYTVKVEKSKATQPEGKDLRIEVVARIQQGGKKAAFMPLYDYINLVSDAALWKVDQFMQAFGVLTKTKRKAEVDDSFFLNKTAQVRVYHENYNKQTPNGVKVEVRPKIGEWIPKGVKVDEAASTTNDEIDLVSHGAAADNGDEDSQAFLYDLAAQHDIDANEIATWEEVVNLIQEAQLAASGEDDVAPEAEAEAGDDEPDLDLLAEAADEGDQESCDKLLELAEDYEGLDPEAYPTWAEMVTEMKAYADDDDAGGGEAEATGTDWSKKGVVDLKKEAKKRDLPTGGTKPELIERLTEYEAANPFEG